MLMIQYARKKPDKYRLSVRFSKESANFNVSYGIYSYRCYSQLRIWQKPFTRN